MQKEQTLCGPEFSAVSLSPNLPIDREDSQPEEEGDGRPNFRHMHDILELGLCRSGYGLFMSGPRLLPFEAGDLSVAAPGEGHWVRSSPGVRSDWTWIFVDHVRLLGSHCSDLSLLKLDRLSGPDFQNVIKGTEHAELQALYRLLCEEVGDQRRIDSIRGLLLAILSQLRQFEVSQVNEVETDSRELARLGSALQAIYTRHHEKLDVHSLARLCNMSVSSFREHFVAAMGSTPYQYLQRYRISMASIELLRGKKTVEVIAEENGFPTLSCFVRQFTRQRGTTPRRWAKEQLAKPAGK